MKHRTACRFKYVSIEDLLTECNWELVCTWAQTASRSFFPHTHYFLDNLKMNNLCFALLSKTRYMTNTVNWELQLGNSRTDQHNGRLVYTWQCSLPHQWLPSGMTNPQTRKTVCKIIKQQSYNANNTFIILWTYYIVAEKIIK